MLPREGIYTKGDRAAGPMWSDAAMEYLWDVREMTLAPVDWSPLGGK